MEINFYRKKNEIKLISKKIQLFLGMWKDHINFVTHIEWMTYFQCLCKSKDDILLNLYLSLFSL